VPFAILFVFVGYFTYVALKKDSKWDRLNLFTAIALILFVLYYTGIFAYRAQAGVLSFNDLLSSVHFAVVFVGGASTFLFSQTKEISRELLLQNLLLFIASLNVLLLVDSISRGSLRDTQVLVNIIIICCIQLIYFAVCYLYLTGEKRNWFFSGICYLHLILANISIWLSGSRLMLAFGIMTNIIFLILSFKHRRQFLQMLGCALAAFLLVGGMYLVDAFNTRELVQRQLFNILPNRESTLYEYDLPIDFNYDDEDVRYEYDLLADPATGYREMAQYHIDRSDSMRATLLSRGREEVRENFWFGTGNVIYEYVLDEIHIFRQGAHNAILESMAAFGFIGTTLILLSLGGVLYGVIKSQPSLDCKILIMYVTFVFLAYSMFQPIFFNIMTFSHTILILTLFKTKDVLGKALGDNT